MDARVIRLFDTTLPRFGHVPEAEKKRMTDTSRLAERQRARTRGHLPVCGFALGRAGSARYFSVWRVKICCGVREVCIGLNTRACVQHKEKDK